MELKEILKITQNLNLWFDAHEYKGTDPYQLDEKTFGIIKIIPQIKHLRSLLKPLHGFIPTKVFGGLEPIYHPKAIGLALSATAKLWKLTNDHSMEDELKQLLNLLVDIKSEGPEDYSWGHPFEWGQNPRYPKDTPLICVTVPVASWILDYFELSGNIQALHICENIAHSLMNRKYYIKTDAGTAVKYSQIDNQYTYNGSAMVAAFLYRIHTHIPNKKFINKANQLIKFVSAEQNSDGSWFYSAEDKYNDSKLSIDNRHTGYILESLSIINRISKNKNIEEALAKGSEYYVHNLLEADLPKWSPEQTYPIDIHDVAQSIITLTELGKYKRANRIIIFALKNMFNGTDEFYFKYFKNKKVNKTVFIRWGQAWMYYALTNYVYKMEQAHKHSFNSTEGK